MNMTIRNWLERSKRRIAARIDRDRFPQECPVFSVSNIHYDVSTRTRAISAGGIGLIHTMVRRLGLDHMINASVQALKLYRPYTESDHTHLRQFGRRNRRQEVAEPLFCRIGVWASSNRVVP